MLKEHFEHYPSLKEARASLREDGYQLSRFHWAGFGEVWEDPKTDFYAVLKNVPWFGLGVFVHLKNRQP
jgi:hypothetical protein